MLLLYDKWDALPEQRHWFPRRQRDDKSWETRKPPYLLIKLSKS
jgi:hypothetical protein